jgi:hypothetical protein
MALGIQCEMRMRHIVIFGPPGSATFFHIISLSDFWKQIYSTQNLS